MRKVIVIGLIAVLFVILMGCVKGIETETDREDVTVEYLFTVDDVKVYRFMDRGRWHYLGTGKSNTNSSYMVEGKWSHNDSLSVEYSK